MSLSMIITMCFVMPEGAANCVLTGKEFLPMQITEAKGCTEAAKESTEIEFLKMGQEGFSHGICVHQSDYANVKKVAIEYLKSKGFKVHFETVN